MLNLIEENPELEVQIFSGNLEGELKKVLLGVNSGTVLRSKAS